MAKMNVYIGFFLLAATVICRVQSTCVFESDFGFKLNCAFKKSSLFRVRNLGGIKAHVGLGFSVGDELGFDQSLTNLDTNKRRSVGITNGSPYNSLGNANQGQQKSNRNKNKQNRITVRQPSSSVAPSSVTQRLSSTIPVTEKITIQGRSAQGSVRQMSPNKPAIPPFKPIPPAQEMLAPAPTVQSFSAYQNSNNRVSQINQNRMGQTAKTNYVNLSAAPVRVINGQSVSNAGDQALRTIPAPSMTTFPQFAAMPASISRISTAAIQVADSPSQNIGMSVVSPQAYKNSVNIQVAPTMMNKFPNIGAYPSNTISLNKKSPPTQSPIFSPQFIANRDYSSKPTQKIDNMLTYNIISGQNGINDYSPQSTLQQKIAALSRATNISMETIEAAVRLRQNQLIQQMLNANPSTTTTTTTQAPRPPPPPPQPLPTLPPKRQYQAPPQQATPTSKVMNAPKEYYPVGYEKNYDDNFITKVDLPETSFYCGDQKHFPGLYGDEDLGCMVFHVCALTDDGLIMKSFLCPESTLFDQTILKCNWWFYVDCKSSKKLYDSNIPISKSYQLMKALTFFSSYKKDIQDADQNPNVPKSTIEENRDGVNNAVKIIQNQANMQLPKVEIVEVNKTDSQQVIRNSKYFTPVNVKEVNALSVAQVDEKENVSEEKDDPPPEVKKPDRGLYRAFSERKEVILDKFTPSAVEDVSTEKSTQKSMSVERTVIKRRPSVSWRIATNSTDSDKTDTKENRRHRTERASEEVEDVSTNEYIISTTVTPKVIIDEVTKSSMNTLIHLSHSDEVRKTIAKMDAAIIGQMKPDT